nr:hypothetical protein [uncultured Pseudomonas sp.]
MIAPQKTFAFVLKIKESSLVNTVLQKAATEEDAKELIERKFPGREILSINEMSE